MRITKSVIQTRLDLLNIMLGRPVDMFNAKTNRINVGHIALDSNIVGYQLEVQTSEGGSVTSLTTRVSGREMHQTINGMILGVTLAAQKAGF